MNTINRATIFPLVKRHLNGVSLLRGPIVVQDWMMAGRSSTGSGSDFKAFQKMGPRL